MTKAIALSIVALVLAQNCGRERFRIASRQLEGAPLECGLVREGEREPFITWSTTRAECRIDDAPAPYNRARVRR